jgi:hypothetical protein
MKHGTTMTRDMLIDTLATRIDAPRHSAQVFLHACFDVVKSLLRSGEEVQLPGIGHWTPRRSPDGTLTAVACTACVPSMASTEAAQEHPGGFDALHFIPVDALLQRSAAVPEPVDVASVVAEVRRLLGGGGETEAHDTFATVVLEEERPEDSTVAVTDDADAPASDDISLLDESDEPLQDATDLSAEDEALLEPDVEEADPLSDEEVFHRNRDQLYHPPDEPGRKTLLIAAAILTFCVLVIVVYLLLDQSEPRDLPGRPAIGACPQPTGLITRT